MKKFLIVLVLFFMSFNSFSNEQKIADFDLEPWYFYCYVGSGCWHDYSEWDGIELKHFKLKVEGGDYGVRTNRQVTFFCNNNEVFHLRIKRTLSVGESTPWLKNPCLTFPKKITSKVGLNGTWGNATIGYYIQK